MSANKNPIKERLEVLYRELQFCKRYYMKIVMLLESDKNKEELKEELNGIIAIMPEFKELDNSSVIKNAKSFSAGSLGKEKFYRLMLESYKQIVDATKCINEEQFF